MSLTRFLQSWFAPKKKAADESEDENMPPIKKLARKLLVDAFIQNATAISLEVRVDSRTKEVSGAGGPCIQINYHINNSPVPQFTIPSTYLEPLLQEFESMSDATATIYYFWSGELLTLGVERGTANSLLTLTFK